MGEGLKRAGIWAGAHLRRTPWVKVAARAGDLATLGALTAFHLVVSRSFTYAAMKFDEQFFLFEGFSMGKGQVPYRDFQEFKPPMIFIANMLALKLFGRADMGFRHFFALLSLAAFLAVAAALLSRAVPRLIVLGAGLLMMNHFLDGTYLEGNVIDTAEAVGLCMFLLALGALLFRCRYKRTLQFIGGAFLAATVLSKEPLLFPVFFVWLALLLIQITESHDPRGWAVFAKHTILGAGFIAVSWLGYLICTRALGWYFVQLHDTMVYSNDHNVKYGIFPKLSFWATWGENLKRLTTKYVNADHLTIFFPYFGAALLLWKGKAIRTAAASLATFLGALYAVTIGHGFFGHYFIMAMLGTFAFVILGAVALGGRISTMPIEWRRWASLSLGLMAIYVVWPRFYKLREQWADFRPQPPAVEAPLVQFVKDHTGANDRIWNIGMPMIYIYSDRRNASRIPFMHDSLLHIYSGKTDAEKLAPYRRELDTTMPKLVIVSPNVGGREIHINLLLSPFLHDHNYHRIPAPSSSAVYERPY